MGVISNLKTAFNAMHSHVEGGGTIASFKASLTSGQRTTLRSDLETVATVEPIMLPAVLYLDSGATVTVKAWKDGDTVCRLVDGYWLEYGPGVGGVDSAGDPALCIPGIGVPWPTNTKQRGWNDHVQSFIDSNDELTVIEAIRDLFKKFRDEE